MLKREGKEKLENEEESPPSPLIREMYRSPISKGRTEVPTSVEDVVEACGEGRRRVSYEKGFLIDLKRKAS